MAIYFNKYISGLNPGIVNQFVILFVLAVMEQQNFASITSTSLPRWWVGTNCWYNVIVLMLSPCIDLHYLFSVLQVKACTAECYQLFHLGLLLKRLVFLMTPNHQVRKSWDDWWHLFHWQPALFIPQFDLVSFYTRTGCCWPSAFSVLVTFN